MATTTKGVTHKKEKEQAWAQMNGILNQITDKMEDELKCVICYELLMEAVTLSCGHSFCQHCIKEWLNYKRVCPICQRDILSQTRSLALDNIIGRLVEGFSTELKELRQALLAERKAAEEVVLISDEDSSDSSDSSGSSVSSGSVPNGNDIVDESDPVSLGGSTSN